MFARLFEGVRRWYWLAGGGLILIVIAAFVLWPGGEEEPRSRQYRDVSACLLTDSAGINSAEAKPVWAGMQDASLKTLGQVRFLSIAGPQDVTNGRTFVNTLVLGKCAVIVAAGKLPVETVSAVARESPNQKFVIVVSSGSTPEPGVGNVSVVSASGDDATRTAVSSAVADSLS
ncbi:basic membrane lipoprotein Med (substrate-binding protein (PBP1-ABC) superfamily) [Hamadaea flava]|uniref:BMP family ABC transporter substrate-binding protein n=1 Tax=Hamadaea flava TaxID=1742688 RepID=A0ABV8LZ53_9ACTN|nr:hypothetical protein [Hamadaea flava]MCP2321619.1 basic membrane lipoprotein Med (substrate-binding protein (PBP1-ABC) superfamily) [Hamadaea flava]